MQPLPLCRVEQAKKIYELVRELIYTHGKKPERAEKLSKDSERKFNVYIVEAEKYEAKITSEDEDDGSFLLRDIYGIFRKISNKMCEFRKTKIDKETISGYSKTVYDEYLRYYQEIPKGQTFSHYQLYWILKDTGLKFEEIAYMMIEMLQAGLLETVVK